MKIKSVLINSISLLVLFFICSIELLSQVNTEVLRRSGLKDGFHTAIDLGLDFNSGNTEYTKFTSSVRVDYFDSTMYSFISGNLEYKEGNDEIITNKGFIHLRGIWHYNNILLPEAFSQVEFNRFLDLHLRWLAGGGLRMLILKRPYGNDSTSLIHINVGIGAMYEHEDYSKNTHSNTRLIRSTNYLSLKWLLHRNIHFETVIYYQVNINDLDDSRILTDNVLEFSVTDVIKFNMSIHYRFDQQPPIDKKDYDFEFVNGIRLLF